LRILAALKAPVDSFFDQVMVMTDDPELRRNRLSLLTQLEALFLSVADLSLLQDSPA
jgi:glycyl-tRNA synthetase beta chain